MAALAWRRRQQQRISGNRAALGSSINSRMALERAQRNHGSSLARQRNGGGGNINAQR